MEEDEPGGLGLGLGAGLGHPTAFFSDDAAPPTDASLNLNLYPTATNSVAAKMMANMGWKGKGLGKNGKFHGWQKKKLEDCEQRLSFVFACGGLNNFRIGKD